MKVLFYIQCATALTIVAALIFPIATHVGNLAVPLAIQLNGIASLVYLPLAISFRHKSSRRLNIISILVSIFFILVNIALLIYDDLLMLIM